MQKWFSNEIRGNPMKSDTAFGAEDVMFDRIALRAGATLKPGKQLSETNRKPKTLEAENKPEQPLKRGRAQTLKPATTCNNQRQSLNPKNHNRMPKRFEY